MAEHHNYMKTKLTPHLLAALQGLNRKLERENAVLRRGLQEIKRLPSTLAKKGNQP